MTALRLERFNTGNEREWDRFVEQSNDGTLFHRLAFLRYHQNRFANQECHLAWRKGEALFSVMPMAIALDNGIRVARSPYGASYGGPVFEGAPTYAECRDVIDRLLEFLAQQSVDKCSLTLPTPCFSALHSDTLRFALLESGFECSNRDITSTADLANPRINSRAQRGSKKALKAGVEIRTVTAAEFYPVLQTTMAKLKLSPTHTLEQLEWLAAQFPSHIAFDIGMLGAKAIAGVGLFDLNRRATLAFYLAQDPEYQQHQALSLLIGHGMEKATTAGKRWFDFGTSSIQMKASPNLFQFKENFGALGVFRETYSLTRPI